MGEIGATDATTTDGGNALVTVQERMNALVLREVEQQVADVMQEHARVLEENRRLQKQNRQLQERCDDYQTILNQARAGSRTVFYDKDGVAFNPYE